MTRSQRPDSQAHHVGAQTRAQRKRAEQRAEGRSPAMTGVFGFLIVCGVATVLGLVWLWPSFSSITGEEGFEQASGQTTETHTGTVTFTDSAPCGSPDVGRVLAGDPRPPMFNGPACPRAFVDITSGPDAGGSTLLELPIGPGVPTVETGDNIKLARMLAADSSYLYSFSDFARGTALLVWGLLAVAAITAVGAWKGLRAVLGIGIALLIVVGWMLPSILDGNSAVLCAMVAGSAILFVVLYVAHGFNIKTHAALTGTLVSLLAAGVLSWLAIRTTSLTGLAEEQNTDIQIYLQTLSITGILLAGFIIGSLGVLNDMTISQAATVVNLFRIDPSASATKIFSGAMEVGRDHIASTVYTLVLAYTGSALPLLLLFSAGDRDLMWIFTSDVVGVEIMRSVVGAIALALSVPLTNIVAVMLARGASAAQIENAAAGGHSH